MCAYAIRITKANPNLVMYSGAFSMLTDITQTKDSILFTICGEILKMGDPAGMTVANLWGKTGQRRETGRGIETGFAGMYAACKSNLA